ncbi:unnamed protein product [Phytophthora fragariaefolia]|uniref:Unnamed protein product n=1 Tax=Phytophthora fragariaefolia TaxID=1490495 RepID=A0A9W6XFC5_9STRA|nr:unnamed protein product [Phytophthora fragariaefolia]
MGFVSAGDIDVCTAYGWIKTGKREFGLGQGSVLSIPHIGYYIEILLCLQENSEGAFISIMTNTPHRQCQLPSFLTMYKPGRVSHTEAGVKLNDGKEIPQLVTMVNPTEGIKHLRVTQSTVDMRSKTIKDSYEQLQLEGRKLIFKKVSVDQLRYIVNHVWVPRVQYRTQLRTSLKVVQPFDKLVRHIARRVLRLPKSTPSELFHDVTQGIGLRCFEDMCTTARFQLALQVINNQHTPTHHLLVEALEESQIESVLTTHPLECPIKPLSHLQGWVHQIILVAAYLGVKVADEWNNPDDCKSQRPNDRSMWKETRLSQTLTLAMKHKSNGGTNDDKRSDIWTIRPDGLRTEYADVCIPVAVTNIGRRVASQVIIWNDTVIDGARRTMGRDLIVTAFQRVLARYVLFYRHGNLPIPNRYVVNATYGKALSNAESALPGTTKIASSVM